MSMWSQNDEHTYEKMIPAWPKKYEKLSQHDPKIMKKWSLHNPQIMKKLTQHDQTMMKQCPQHHLFKKCGAPLRRWTRNRHHKLYLLRVWCSLAALDEKLSSTIALFLSVVLPCVAGQETVTKNERVLSLVLPCGAGRETLTNKCILFSLVLPCTS